MPLCFHSAAVCVARKKIDHFGLVWEEGESQSECRAPLSQIELLSVHAEVTTEPDVTQMFCLVRREGELDHPLSLTASPALEAVVVAGAQLEPSWRTANQFATPS